MTSQFLSELVEASVLEKVKKECRNLCDPKVKSVLRQTHATALEEFSWDTLLKEWEDHAPTFLKFLQASADNSYSPTIGCAGRSVHIVHTCIIGCVF